MTINYQTHDNQDASEIREMLKFHSVPANLIEEMTDTIYCEFRKFNVQIDFTESGGLIGYKIQKA